MWLLAVTAMIILRLPWHFGATRCRSAAPGTSSMPLVAHVIATVLLRASRGRRHHDRLRLMRGNLHSSRRRLRSVAVAAALLLVALARLTVSGRLLRAVVLLRPVKRARTWIAASAVVIVPAQAFVEELVVTIMMVQRLLLLRWRIAPLLILLVLGGRVLMAWWRLRLWELLDSAATVRMAHFLRLAVEAVELGVQSVVLTAFLASGIAVGPAVLVAAHRMHLLLAHYPTAAMLALGVTHLSLASRAQMHALMAALRRAVCLIAT